MRPEALSVRFPALLVLLFCAAGCELQQASSSKSRPIEKLIQDLRSNDARSRANAASSLSERSDAESALLAVLTDASAPLDSRLFALELVCRGKGMTQACQAALAKALSDANPDLRQQAARRYLTFKEKFDFTPQDLQFLVMNATDDVIRETGVFLCAGKVNVQLSEADLVSAVVSLCRASTWHNATPATTLSLLARLDRDGRPFDRVTTTKLLEAYHDVVRRVPKTRDALLSERRTVMTAGRWISPPRSDQRQATNRSFPATDSNLAELQTVDLVCELCDLIVARGQLTEEQFQHNFRRPRTDPFHLLSERSAGQFGPQAVIRGLAERLESDDPIQRRAAAAALAEIEPPRLLTQISERLMAGANVVTDKISVDDAEHALALMRLLTKAGTLPRRMTASLQLLARHSDAHVRQSAWALLILTKDPSEPIDLEDGALLSIIESSDTPVDVRYRILRIFEQRLPIGKFPSQETGAVLGKIANSQGDPLRDELIHFLSVRNQSNAGGALQELRTRMFEKVPDVWIDRLEFTATGQVRVGGCCMHEKSEAASREVIEKVLNRHLLLGWSAWHQTGTVSRLSFRDACVVEIKLVPDLVKAIRAAIRERNDLKGCGVAGLSISPQGEVLLAGMTRHSSLKAELTRLAESIRGSSTWKGIWPGQIIWTSWVETGTQQLVENLRAWSTDHKLEAWIDDMVVDHNGHLVIRGWCSRELESAWLRARLIEVLNSYPLGDFLKEQHRADFDGAIDFSLEIRPISWFDELSQAASGGKVPAQVLIEHVYYDSRGQLLIEGCCESAEAFARIEPVLQDVLRSNTRQQDLPQGYEIFAFRVLDDDELVIKLGDMISLCPQCPLLRITEGKRDAAGKLLLAGESAVALDQAIAHQALRLLARLPGGAHVLEDGARFRSLKVTAQRKDSGERHLQNALKHAADLELSSLFRSLQFAQLHLPESSTVWYLVSLQCLIRGADAEAKEYLSRTAVLEERHPQELETRLKQLEPLQGSYWNVLNNRASKLLAELARQPQSYHWPAYAGGPSLPASPAKATKKMTPQATPKKSMPARPKRRTAS